MKVITRSPPLLRQIILFQQGPPIGRTPKGSGRTSNQSEYYVVFNSFGRADLYLLLAGRDCVSQRYHAEIVGLVQRNRYS